MIGQARAAALAARPGWRAAPGEALAAPAPSGSSFYWALRLLPRDRREAIFAVYAFCRTVDDIADGEADPDHKLGALARWRREIELLFDGVPAHAVTRALAAPCRQFELQRDDFLAVIDGMEMDARGHMVAPGRADLELYCRRVAGAVGLLSAAIFGLPRAAGRRLALSLGPALQYTNILRDLAEDAARGRLYLPRELLDDHGIGPRAPAAVLAHPALPEVASATARLAEDYYRAALDVLADCPGRRSWPARAILAIYRGLLRRLRARGFTPEALRRPVAVSRWAKAAIALREALRP